MDTLVSKQTKIIVLIHSTKLKNVQKSIKSNRFYKSQWITERVHKLLHETSGHTITHRKVIWLLYNNKPQTASVPGGACFAGTCMYLLAAAVAVLDLFVKVS